MLCLSEDKATVSVNGHAKINATLDVLGVRQDGYHELRSLVVPVELCDTVSVSRSGCSSFDVDVHVRGDGVDIGRIGPPGKNLAVRAARIFASGFPVTGRFSISIAKRIPLGGGLGGGSADAAAVFLAMNALCGNPFSMDRLLQMGAAAGSDVPAMLCGKPVVMEGRGERVTPYAGYVPECHVLLANPNVHVSTPEVFSAWDRMSGSRLTNEKNCCRIISSRNCGCTLADFSAVLSNGLEETVCLLHPEVAEVIGRLREAGAKAVSMSGSGATVFALAESPAEAAAYAESLPRGCWYALTRTVPDGVMAAHGPLEA